MRSSKCDRRQRDLSTRSRNRRDPLPVGAPPTSPSALTPGSSLRVSPCPVILPSPSVRPRLLLFLLILTPWHHREPIYAGPRTFGPLTPRGRGGHGLLRVAKGHAAQTRASRANSNYGRHSHPILFHGLYVFSTQGFIERVSAVGP